MDGDWDGHGKYDGDGDGEGDIYSDCDGDGEDEDDDAGDELLVPMLLATVIDGNAVGDINDDRLHS